jgi:hypothetical protein
MSKAEQRFLSSLFPGDQLPGRPNRHNEPVVDELLDEVSCQSGIEKRWLEDAAGLVIDGFAGIQCLWFLHGLSGTVEGFASMEPDEPRFQSSLNRILRRAAVKATKKAPQAVIVRYSPRWAEGLVIEYRANGETGELRERTMKLGRFLKKHDASDELLHAFETREMPVWEWFISAHPIDVLTMSHGRAWTSCMRPGEAYQFGPLTDMAAGSALLFFKRPGADKPCGRVVLRPIVNGYGGAQINYGGTVYGCGPSGFDVDDFEELVTDELGRVEVVEEPLCPHGEQGMALTRYIYSDTDPGSNSDTDPGSNSACSQSQELYDEAYERLVEARWPPSKLDAPKERAIAVRFEGRLDSPAVDRAEGFDLDEATELGERAGNEIFEAAEGILEAIDLLDPTILDESINYNLEGVGRYDDAFAASIEGTSNAEEYIGDVYSTARSTLEQRILDQLSKERSLVVVTADPDESAMFDDVQEALNSVEKELRAVSLEPYESFSFDTRSMDHYTPAFRKELYDLLHRVAEHEGDDDVVDYANNLYVIPESVAQHGDVKDVIKKGKYVGKLWLDAGEWDWSDMLADV